MLNTWLTRRFDLSIPVISAPMAGGVSTGRLAAAVSSAGALGMIGIAQEDPADVAEHAAIARDTGRPFGIGLIAWVAELTPAVVEAVIAQQPALLSVSFGDYAKYVDMAHDAGIAVTTQAGTVDDAKAAIDSGVDFVVARGSEGGGHGRGEIATLPLLQEILEAVDVPVVAAGGIATARGLAAVLAAGAVGAWVGTAFVASVESGNSAAKKAQLVAAGSGDTLYSTVMDIGRGVPWPSPYGGRAIRTPFGETWHGREDELRQAGARMDEDAVWAGEAIGLVTAERPAGDIVRDLAKAEAFLGRSFAAES